MKKIKNWFIGNYQMLKFFFSSDYEPDYPWPFEEPLDNEEELV